MMKASNEGPLRYDQRTMSNFDEMKRQTCHRTHVKPPKLTVAREFVGLAP